MSREASNQPELSLVEAHVGYSDVSDNFPEIRTVEETEGVLTVDIDLAQFDVTILQRHEFGSFRDAYDTRGDPRGLCLIISNRKFDPPLEERIGTDVDCENLSTLFRKLLYKVEVKKDQTADQIKDVCHQFIMSSEHANYSSCILAILTHGKEGELFGSDSKTVKEYSEILAHFNHPECKLARKPKLAIIQACRIHLGSQEKQTQHPPMSREITDGPIKEGSEEFDIVEHLRRLNYKDGLQVENWLQPDMADLLIAHSTLPGYVSWRHKEHGSWFIQAIVQVFARNFKSEHVADMMVQVNQVISEAFGQNRKSQMPCPTNHLRRKFYFFPSMSFK